MLQSFHCCSPVSLLLTGAYYAVSLWDCHEGIPPLPKHITLYPWRCNPRLLLRTSHAFGCVQAGVAQHSPAFLAVFVSSSGGYIGIFLKEAFPDLHIDMISMLLYGHLCCDSSRSPLAGYRAERCKSACFLLAATPRLQGRSKPWVPFSAF